MPSVTTPFLPLAQINTPYSEEFLRLLPETLKTDSLILGKAVEDFERSFASYCGTEFAFGVGNGLDALAICLAACGVGPGDEVIVPSNTFIATLLAASSVGATPVLVEPDEETFCLDPSRVEAAITPRTRAILPVHLYGHAADVAPLMEIAQRRNLVVIEDAAQAQGAVYRKARVGALGHMAAFSFYPGKNLGALGDAGAITTRDPDLARKVELIRNYGSPRKYVHDTQLGRNSRLDTLQALFLSIKLKDLDRCNQARRDVAARYTARITHPLVKTPRIPTPADLHVWHLYVVRTPHRNALMEHLAREGVQSLIHYPTPPHRQQAYAELAGLSLPISEAIHREVVSLPIYPGMTEDQVEHVVNAVNSWNGSE